MQPPARVTFSRSRQTARERRTLPGGRGWGLARLGAVPPGVPLQLLRGEVSGKVSVPVTRLMEAEWLLVFFFHILAFPAHSETPKPQPGWFLASPVLLEKPVFL